MAKWLYMACTQIEIFFEDFVKMANYYMKPNITLHVYVFNEWIQLSLSEYSLLRYINNLIDGVILQRNSTTN